MILIQTVFHGDDVRLPLRPRHRELLQGLVDEGILLLGGPFEDASGGALLFDATIERVQQYLDSDPYMTCADVEIIAVKEWQPMLGTKREELGVGA
ncbi:YciI family protein [Pseudactinotalea suaedae]|jgi:uncharacterized protein YciI|uniref:YciI family protein n=1 Tax=Pseudactinotalea suaedae TaxID=1524924 RepID=UPI0012E29C62|nr:YciI family protein [Pseudactinotalea suaedae]